MFRHITRFALLTALAHLVLELCFNFMPLIYPILIADFGLTYSQVGTLALVAIVTGSVTQPLFGFLSDRLGPNRLLILSLVWSGGLMGLVGLIQSYGALLLLVGVAVLGSAAFHPAGVVLAATTTSKQRGAAISIFSVGGNLGVAFSPLLVAVGLSRWGLQGTLIIIPVVLLAALLLQWQMKQQVAFTQPQKATKSDTAASQTGSTGLALGLALIVATVMTRSWFQVSMMTYLPEWIQSQGHSLTFGGQMLALFLFSISLGSLTGGPLSDRIGRWQIVITSLVLLSLGQWLFLQASGVWQMGLAAWMGLMIGASFPVTIVMAQEIWPRGVGLASALVMGFGWAPGGLGAWVTGLLADQFSLATGLHILIWVPLLGVGCALLYVMVQQRRPVSSFGVERV